MDTKGSKDTEKNQESLEALKRKLDEVTEKWKRALADYANLEKRVEKEKAAVTEFASSVIITSFLPILDNLQEASKKSSDSGFDLILRQFKEVLEASGVTEIKALGKSFDPQEHEAVEIVGGDKDNKVVEVLRVGYKIGDKVLRPSRVKVSKKRTDF